MQPAANLAPISNRKPPANAAGIVTPFVVADVSEESAERNPPNMAAGTYTTYREYSTELSHL